MANCAVVNLSSLNIVSAELEETIELALRGWVSFHENPMELTPLKSAAQCFSQVNGALHIIELSGMAMLSQELLLFTETTIERGKAPTDTVVKKVILAVESLARYLCYVRANAGAKPSLLIPTINAVRGFNRRPRIAEHSFTELQIEGDLTLPELDFDVDVDLDSLALSVRRLRQMYQTGLIAILRGDPPSVQLGLMQRACERTYGVLRKMPVGKEWFLKAAVLGGMASDQLELTSSRMQLLSEVDRAYKDMLSSLQSKLSDELDEPMRDEYLYLISLLQDPGPMARLVSSQVAVHHTDIESTLREERAFVHGTNSAIHEQRMLNMGSILNSIREYLDAASKQNSFEANDLTKLGSQLDELRSLLGGDKSESLAELLSLLELRRRDIAGWIKHPDSVTWDGLMPLADVLIMVEDALDQAGAIAGGQLGMGEKAAANALKGAELAVVTEAQSGLNTAKRAITSYVESGFDRVHLGNIATTLDCVRGGLQLLRLRRATDILTRSTQFIETTIKSQSGENHSILETLADALISLEYYLTQLELRDNADDSVLNVADESLREIGFPAIAA